MFFFETQCSLQYNYDIMAIFQEIIENENINERHPLSKAIIRVRPTLRDNRKTVRDRTKVGIIH